MLDTNVLLTGEHWKIRMGAFILLAGLVSLAQAANLFPIGRSEYPAALILIAIGGTLSLDSVSKKGSALKAIQITLVLLAVSLIIVF